MDRHAEPVEGERRETLVGAVESSEAFASFRERFVAELGFELERRRARVEHTESGPVYVVEFVFDDGIDRTTVEVGVVTDGEYAVTDAGGYIEHRDADGRIRWVRRYPYEDGAVSDPYREAVATR